MKRIPLAYAPWMRWFLTLLGIGPRRSSIQVTPDRLRVHMGYAFRTDAAREAITGAEHVLEPVHRRVIWGVGVHGGAGHWRVNGATGPIVRIRFEPRQPARVLGIPVKLHTLDVSVAEPADLLNALAQQ